MNDGSVSAGTPAETAPPPKEGELPKRRRQTHLAPQLKERVDARLAARGQAPPASAAEPAGPRPVPEPAGMPLGAPVPMDAAPPAGTVPAGGTPDDAAARSPEAMRSMLSAMQSGWQRGRQDAAGAEAARNPGDQEDDTP